MISLERLVWDGRIQLVLGALALVAWLVGWSTLLGVLLVLILLWQMGSALELYYDYQHHSRMHYLWAVPLALVLAICWLQVGLWTGIICMTVYAWHTVHDYLIVRRRPKSFWDI